MKIGISTFINKAPPQKLVRCRCLNLWKYGMCYLILQIDGLETSIRDMKMNISNLQQNNKTAVNQIAEQQTELEHLKSELVESRSQYKEAAQEVNGTYLFLSFF